MPRLKDTQRLPIPPTRQRWVAPSPAAVAIAAQERGTVRRWHRGWWGETWRWLLTTLVWSVLAAVLLGASLLGAIFWQARTDQTRPVDAIVVLGTAQFDCRPAPVLRARLDAALAAYRAGSAPLIVLTGGRLAGDRCTEAEAGRDYLLARGVPATAIVLENRGRTSFESLEGVARIAADEGLERLLLVSDGFHLLRVRLMAEDLGLTAYGAPAPTSPIRPGSGLEREYMVREAGAIVAYLWQSRLGS